MPVQLAVEALEQKGLLARALEEAEVQVWDGDLSEWF